MGDHGRGRGFMSQSEGRVNKREFIVRVSRRSGRPIREVTAIMEAGGRELMDIMREDQRLMITGFGSFYPQAHKGHRVQFSDEAGGKVIGDYSVLKFSATRDVNRSLDRRAAE